MAWPDLFLDFFRSISPHLTVVLNASGCREGWIQGELYRHFWTPQNRLLVNCSYSSNRVKHDIYCEQPTEMVAELKVYGYAEYYNKNLYGKSNIKRFLPAVVGGRVALSHSEIHRLQPAAGSYLSDVLRLQTVPSTVERYMILVIQKAGEADEFGRAIL
jgi:hypothetical protein